MNADGVIVAAVALVSAAIATTSLAGREEPATHLRSEMADATLVVAQRVLPRMRSTPAPEARFSDTFAHAGSRGRLITNAHATFDSWDPRRVRSTRWEMTSGSLFSRGGRGWTGPPDLARPGARSANGTGSAVFRLLTRRRDFGDVDVRLRVRVLRWTRLRPEQLPLVVLWVRFASAQRLYSPSVLRADAKADIEKKIPGGPHPVNGGTYYILAPYTNAPDWPVTLGRWYDVGVQVCNGPDGSVTITTTRDGRVMRRAVDRGSRKPVQDARSGLTVTDPAAALRSAGRVGIRADDAELELGRFRVRPAARLCRAGDRVP